jgi:hypothetical protein
MKNTLKKSGKIKQTLPRLYLPLLILLTAGYCMTSLPAGTDFWAHAAVGRWIITHHQIPQQTLFLWSDKIPWIWHSWLSKIIFYECLAHVPENIGSLIAMIITAFAAIFSLLIWWKVWLKNQVKLSDTTTPGLLAALIFFLAIYVAHERFFPRPEIFSAVLLTLLLLLLVRGVTSWRSLIAIFLMFALWANLHAGLAVGLVFLTITFLCNLLQDRNWKISRWELLAIIAAIAGVFVNPYGWHYWAALKPVASVTFSFINEWKPFWKTPLMETPIIISAFLCFAAAFAAWLVSERRRLEHLGWLIAAFVLFIMARRNTWILAQVVLAVVACNPKLFVTAESWNRLQKWLHRKQIVSIPTKLQTVARWGMCVWLFYAVLAAPSNKFWFGHFVDPDAPRQAAQFLRTIPTGQRIFNDYEISSYLEWKLNGKPPLFIDLLNAYHPDVMQDYVNTIDGGGEAAQLLKKWHINYIILPQIENDQFIGRLFVWLSVQPKWEMVYNQADGVIWKYNPNAKPKSLFQLQ